MFEFMEFGKEAVKSSGGRDNVQFHGAAAIAASDNAIHFDFKRNRK